MTQPQILDLPAVYEGTTWEGINSVSLQQPVGTLLPLTDAQLRMVYWRVGENLERLNLVVGAGIQVTNAAGGVFKVLPQILPLTAGFYYWHIILTQANGTTIPLFAGTQEITRLGRPS